MENLRKEDQGRHVDGHLECHGLGSEDRRTRSSRSGPIFKEKKREKEEGEEKEERVIEIQGTIIAKPRRP